MGSKRAKAEIGGWRERLKTAMINAGISQADLAPVFGVSRAAVSHYMTGRTEPSLGQIMAVAKHVGVSLDYLLGGEAVNEVGVPLLAWKDIEAFVSGTYRASSKLTYVRCPIGSCSEQTFAVRVQGDSMESADGYRHGDLILVDPDKPPLHGCDVVARLPEQRPVLRRLSVHEDGNRYLWALNGRTPSQNMVALPADALILGVVTFSGQDRG